MYFPTVDFRRGNLRYSCPISAIDLEVIFCRLEANVRDYENLHNIFRLEDSTSDNRTKLYLGDIEIESDADVIAALAEYLRNDDYSPTSIQKFLRMFKLMRRDYIYFAYYGCDITPGNPYFASLGNILVLLEDMQILCRGDIVSIDTTSFLVNTPDCPNLCTIKPTYPDSIDGEIILRCLRYIQEKLGLDITVSERGGIIQIDIDKYMRLRMLLDFLAISVNNYMELPPSKKSAAK